jgi:hypothetical protein
MTDTKARPHWSVFQFPPIARLLLRGNLWRSGAARFHKGANFKATAALYHLDRLQRLYADYLRTQPEPTTQEIHGLDDPSRRELFFEFTAILSNLWACMEAMLQEVNSMLGLGLSVLREEGRRSVSRGAVADALRARGDTMLLPLLEQLRDDGEEHEWFEVLTQLRHAVVHTEIYSQSYETRLLDRILRRAVDAQGESGDVAAIGARDVVIRLGEREWVLSDLAEVLVDRSLDYMVRLQEAMNAAVAGKMKAPPDE